MKLTQLNQIDGKEEPRIQTGVEVFDDFLGGGFVASYVGLLAGLPGNGKSTLLMQVAARLANNGYKILYCTGEETLNQIKLRADRLYATSSLIWCSDTTELNEIKRNITQLKPNFTIIDSMQMLYSNKIKSDRMSNKQVKECLLDLIDFTKKSDQVLILIGHSNKSGQVAGLLTLQHMVDSVMYIKKNTHNQRTLESIKNRFGATDKIINLSMEENGFREFVIPRIEENYSSLQSLFDKIFHRVKNEEAIQHVGTFKPKISSPMTKKLKYTYSTNV